MSDTKDGIKLRTKWRIDKFKDPTGEIVKALKSGMKMDEAIEKFKDHFIATEKFEDNVALNEGLQAIINLLAGIGVPPTLWDAANAYVGVGDGAGVEDPTDPGLLGLNKFWVDMDGGYPARVAQTCDWRGTFAPGEANFAWEEYTVVNAVNDAGENLNRRATPKGTKVLGETWTLSLQITFS